MESLFPLDDEKLPSIPGLRYLREYVTRKEEIDLADAIDRMPGNTEWDRRRQPYGGFYGVPDTVTPPIPALPEPFFGGGSVAGVAEAVAAFGR